MDVLIRAFASDDDGVVVAADGGDVVNGGDRGAGDGDGDASDSDSDAFGGDQEDAVSDMSN